MNIHALSCTSAQSSGTSRHSVWDDDAPPGIEQDTWDKADVDERRQLIEESEQQAWLSPQTVSPIVETLPSSMSSLLQPSATETGAPFVLRDLTGALASHIPPGDRGMPQIIGVPQTYTVALGDTPTAPKTTPHFYPDDSTAHFDKKAMSELAVAPISFLFFIHINHNVKK